MAITHDLLAQMRELWPDVECSNTVVLTDDYDQAVLDKGMNASLIGVHVYDRGKRRFTLVPKHLFNYHLLPGYMQMLQTPTPVVTADGVGYRLMIVHIKADDEYRLFVGDDKIRYFNEAGLPEEIRARLSMIRAAAEQYFKPVGVIAHDKSKLFGGYTNEEFPREFDDIGWQITPPPVVWYCVIVNEKLLDSLRGEP